MKKYFIITMSVLLLTTLSSCCKHETAITQDKLIPDCTESGYTGDLFCPECEKIITEGESIPAVGHTGERQDVKEVTCSEDGYTGDIRCTDCGLTLESGELIEKLPHTEERINVVEATCTNPGDTGDVICTVCEQTLERGEVIDQLPHEWAAVNSIASTCLTEGYEGDLTCKNCSKEQRGDILSVTDHTFKDGTCTICGWITPGLYVDDELVLTWEELKEYNYVYVDANGQFKSTQGNFQYGKLVIGEDVTYIDGNYATGFKNNTLSEVWIPRTVTKLGNYLLYRNNSITDIVMFCQITELMESTFRDGEALKNLVLPDSIKRIGQDAFDGCTSLTHIDLPENLEYIGREAFWSCPLTSINLPDSVKEIARYAFAECPVQSVKLPASLQTLGDSVFYECNQLQSVDMSACENLTYLESTIFKDCVSLQEVKLPPNLTGMDSGIFAGCTSLRRLALPEGFTSLNLNKYYATFRNASVNEIVIPKSLITIGDLGGCPITSIKYRGTETQWKLTTGYGQFPNAAIEYNYTGE